MQIRKAYDNSIDNTRMNRVSILLEEEPFGTSFSINEVTYTQENSQVEKYKPKKKKKKKVNQMEEKVECNIINNISLTSNNKSMFL